MIREVWNWLLTADTRAESLSELIQATLSGSRRWVRRADLQPTYPIAHYNPDLEKLELGPFPSTTNPFVARNIETISDTTSAASYTMTVPADTYRLIVSMSMKNSNRQSFFYARLDPDGASPSCELEGVASGGAAWTTQMASAMVPFWMDEADQITLIDNLFVGGDTMQFNIAYVDVSKI